MRITKRFRELALVALDTTVAVQAMVRDPHSQDSELTQVRDSSLNLARRRLDRIPPLNQEGSNSPRRR